VQCSAPNCVLSPRHPPTCRGEKCMGTCHQMRQQPERADPWYIQDFCPGCRSAGFSL
ncbi:hypothetical protein C2E23DRAFT_721842, partial [Lenzites betulinus]